MKKAILATKVGMTQIFNEEDGVLIPVTVLQAGPCVVTQVKQLRMTVTAQYRLDMLTRKKRLSQKTTVERSPSLTETV